MKRGLSLLAFLATIFCVTSKAQNPPAAAIVSGTSLPATCQANNRNVFVLISGTSGTPYYCSAPNTWSLWSGGGGGSPAGPPCAVQFDNSGSFGGNAAFCWDNADLLAKIGGSPITPFAGLYVGPDESTLPALLQGYTFAAGTLFTFNETPMVSEQTAFGFESVANIGAYFVNVGDAQGEGDAIALQADSYAGAVNDAVYGVIAFASDQGFANTSLIALRAKSASIFGPGAPVSVIGLQVDDQTGATNNWAIKTGLGLVDIGDVTMSQGYKSADGTTGVTVSACTAFKNGLCVSGT